MNSPARPKFSIPEFSSHRQWQAKLSLGIEVRQQRSVLVSTKHEGPLRVQRPFYPEDDGCCHVYLLHPPGGLVVGDELQVSAHLGANARALLTTPSAGKIYGVKASSAVQKQTMHFCVEEGACLEWLPQETIVFNGARGRLHTRFDLFGDAKIFAWDMIRLGRVASGEQFAEGTCHQNIEIWRDDSPLLVERNKIDACSELHQAQWGLRGKNSSGTLFATVTLARTAIDRLYKKLETYNTNDCLWGLTQKEDVFIARYLGDSITHCRKGFELIWRETRRYFNKKNAVLPRIWNT